MIIMVFGYCVKNNPKSALKGIDYAKSYISENQGVCLTGAAHEYLGQAVESVLTRSITVPTFLISPPGNHVIVA